MTNREAAPASSREDVWGMFDRIAPRYDRVNRILSLRRDVAWRRRLARFLSGRRSMCLLDLATGTGDQILHLLDGGADLVNAVGMDMAETMLALGREKIAKRGLQDRVSLRTGDATAIPAESEAFDAVTISFGIRNVGDVSAALAEMRRVLVPGGRALVLEFSMPQGALARGGYVFYLRHLLPWIGGALSGDVRAYRYLNKTIESFACGEAFCALMRDAGFENVEAHPLTLGVATIYKGDKTS